MKHWLYDRRTLLLLLAILFGIQLFIFFVYDLNPDALGYMLLLEFVLINIYLVLDYWRHTLSHRFLTAQRKVPDLSWMEFDGTLKDRDYQRIIRQREKLRHEQAEQYRRDQQHMQDIHDLWVHQNKLPIAALKLLLEDPQPDIREMKSQVLRLEQYTQMILAAARLDSPETDYVFDWVKLDDILRSTIRTFSPEFIRRKLRLDYSGTEEKALTDARWLTFVLEQIISNAVKYARHEIVIQVSDAQITIRDDGPGIPGQDLERIWTKGVTGANGRRRTSATGLGLYLARTVMDRLGHDIRISTSQETGTAVTIDLRHAGILEHD
ncbi:HAMP domain-containing sensor histidine kinase [uncultured Faecalibaculum sp.]|uniref:sensor histidine kinase n=1 Tax=uncultured Faecalibaculum sp. TaxID=1729681 RepID=UPI0026062587|nr:sensor histidine kinase [uncultured Faecalibaculum sp.]